MKIGKPISITDKFGMPDRYWKPTVWKLPVSDNVRRFINMQVRHVHNYASFVWFGVAQGIK